MLLRPHRSRNQYQREVCEVERDPRGRTLSEQFQLRLDVHHIEHEYLERQP